MGDFERNLREALAGRYRLERELGRGGMGVVFLAEDLKHGRKVALKVLRPELAQSLGADRFLREIRISAGLNHPNILTLIDSGSAADFMYYVLPYVEGESLADRLKREPQLPLDEALRITREAADALAYAHAAGIVHRDIKPENILFEAGHSLVEPEGDLYVMRADGIGSPRQLTADSASDRLPRWSPDGNWIAVFSDRSGPLQIWKIRPDGSGLTQVTDALTNVAYPVWSPDGSRMAAGTTLGDSGTTTYLFDPNRPWKEQQPDVLAAPDSLPFGPHSWSPDGRRIGGMVGAFDRGIVVYTLGSRTYERLTTYGQWPVWLPDSRRLLFVSGGKAFYVVDRETKVVRKIFEVTRDVIGPPQLTPDGRTVYFTRRVTEADIWLATLR